MHLKHKNIKITLGSNPNLKIIPIANIPNRNRSFWTFGPDTEHNLSSKMHPSLCFTFCSPIISWTGVIWLAACLGGLSSIALRNGMLSSHAWAKRSYLSWMILRQVSEVLRKSFRLSLVTMMPSVFSARWSRNLNSTKVFIFPYFQRTSPRTECWKLVPSLATAGHRGRSFSLLCELDE